MMNISKLIYFSCKLKKILFVISLTRLLDVDNFEVNKIKETTMPSGDNYQQSKHAKVTLEILYFYNK